MKFFGKTDQGMVRSSNQDALFYTGEQTGVLENIFVVCDGMGGHNAGEYASARALESLVEEIKSSHDKKPLEAIQNGFSMANNELYTEAERDEAKRGMGTTMVAAAIFKNHLVVANVGDSRLYILSPGGIRQVTQDHSIVEELVRRGVLTEEDASHHAEKHKITRAVGAEATVRVDFFEEDLQEDDIVLMCTDGLTNMLDDVEIQQIAAGDGSLEERVDRLINRAKENGGLDNITALLIEPFK